MSGVVGINRLGAGYLAVPPYPAWPLKVSGNGRYLVDQAGVPFRVHCYAFWNGISSIQTSSDLGQILDALVAIGINAVFVNLADHDGEGGTGKSAGNGPFTSAIGAFPYAKQSDGVTAYAGTGYSGSYDGNGNANGPTPTTADMSTVTTAHLQWVDTFVQACEARGMLVMLFPCYTGFNFADQGWGTDITAVSTAKMHSFGATLGARYKNQQNIMWMAYGDADPAAFTGGVAAIQNVIQGIQSAGANQLWGGHLPVNEGDPIAGNATIGAFLSVRSVYFWTFSTDDHPIPGWVLDACNATPTAPSWLFDVVQYENVGILGGTDPTNCRKRQWWGALSGTAGHMFGNRDGFYAGGTGNTSTNGTFAGMNTTSCLQSDGHAHAKVMCQFFKKIPWWKMLPSGVGSMGTLITAGGGSGQTFVASSAATDGTVMLAYVPPTVAGGTSITVASFAMSKTYTAWWVDPANGAAQQIGVFATGARSFTTPAGNNSYGTGDWVLYLTV